MRTGRVLPNDPEALKALVIDLDATVAHLHLELENLKIQLARHARTNFGRSSERSEGDRHQLELAFEALVREVAVTRERAVRVKEQVEATARPQRQDFPEHLPREIKKLPAPSCCPDCGGALRALKSQPASMLEWVPGNFKVVQYERDVRSCAHCDTVVAAPAAPRAIGQSHFGASVAAHVLVSKYCDHLPLYRQSGIYARQGLDLSRSSLADLAKSAINLLSPLAEAVRRHVFAGSKVHGDDTVLPVLDPGRGRTQQGRLWVYARDDRKSGSADPTAVWYDFSPDRTHERAREHLATFRGILQADAWPGFEGLDGERLVFAPCWAHVRRKLYDVAQATGSPVAHNLVERINQLFAIEEQIAGRPPDKRAQVRRARAGPILEQLKSALLQALGRERKRSELAKAIRYALVRYAALSRYLRDGRMEIDNNIAERALRGVALGRKNFLFAGSHPGGKRAATIYTLIETARLYGIDPEEYLRHVLERVAEYPINRIEELLPWHLDPAKAPDLPLAA